MVIFPEIKIKIEFSAPYTYIVSARSARENGEVLPGVLKT